MTKPFKYWFIDYNRSLVEGSWKFWVPRSFWKPSNGR